MITEEITRVMANHLMETNSAPKKIYLGLEEWSELKAHALAEHNFVMKHLRGDKRPEYRGAKIYLVDDESYLCVGD